MGVVILCIISFGIGYLVGRQHVSCQIMDMIREIPDALRRDAERGKTLEDVILETEREIAKL